ncbi:histidine kinase [Parvularcula sp. ZS-1/3]|uniref:Histidine kinase n=1 Tax=Parvularcula mediterranea TaxID=2732508 RepID=A0A7Y3RMR0_9PROT|nr:histidine kinase [Parvularcula mediterranea]NNU16855.1 histidine kinase [Parvularcula mediterranea]
MESRSERAPLLIINAGVWLLFMAFQTLITLLEGAAPYDVPQRGGTYVLSALLTFAGSVILSGEVERRGRGAWPFGVAVTAGCIVVHALIAAAIYKSFPPLPYFENRSFTQLGLAAALYGLPIVLSALLGALTFQYGRAFSAMRALSAEREAAMKEAQLTTLHQQLRPHFLFNTLNTVSAFILRGENMSAERTVLLLSDLLRRSLYEFDDHTIPLSEEMEIASIYLEIEGVRYEERLTVEQDIDASVHGWPVPPFLLQPLIENVVKHAVSIQREPVLLSVAAKEEGGRLHITIEDDGPGLGSGSSQGGIGLENVRRRLKLLYGEGASFTIESREPSGVRATIHLPREVV